MNNQIITLSSKQIDNTIQDLKNKDFMIVELDGKNIKNRSN